MEDGRGTLSLPLSVLVPFIRKVIDCGDHCEVEIYPIHLKLSIYPRLDHHVVKCFSRADTVGWCDTWPPCHVAAVAYALCLPFFLCLPLFSFSSSSSSSCSSFSSSADLEKKLRATFSTPEGKASRVWHCSDDVNMYAVLNPELNLQDVRVGNMQVNI